MKYCPKCSKEYPNYTAQFCNTCGSVLVDKEVNEKGKEIICPSCGKQIPYAQQYCSFCGSNLKSADKDGTTKNNGDNKRTNLIIVIALAVAAVVGAIGIRLYNTNQNIKDGNGVQTTYASEITYNLGDTIFFGATDQDNDSTNGLEPIEWLIIDKDGEQYLLISKYALVSLQYNKVAEDTSWANCSLRYWLNNDFLNDSFSTEELNNISTVKSPLSDKVFVLSIDEATQYFTTASARRASATKTAIAQGSYQENGICGWWLRDMGDTNRIAARVNKYGEIVTYDSTEGGVERTDYSVRPAIWITIK